MIKKLTKYFTVMDAIRVFIKYVMVYRSSKLNKFLKWTNFIVMSVTTQ